MKDIVLNGTNVSYFNEILEYEIGEKSAINVLDKAQEILIKAPDPNGVFENNLGLLYGLVQSGKTNIINMTIALAADNGYKLFIVLTDNNNALQEQTFERVRDSLEEVYPYTIATLKTEDTDLLKSVLNNEGLAIVCKKHTADITSLQKFIEKLEAFNLPAIIIDDEADAVGLNTKQRLEDTSPSVVNQHLLSLKNSLNLHLYLQVTATPQAIILQDDFMQPKFTLVSEAGDGYVGIDTIFTKAKEKILSYVDPEEISTLLKDNSNVRIPTGLLNAICSFLVGATLKILLEEKENRRKKINPQFSFMIHVSQTVEIHNKLKTLILSLKKDLYDTLTDNLDNEILLSLKASYASLYTEFINDIFNNEDKKKYTANNVFEVIRKNLKEFEVMVLNSSSDSKLNNSKSKYLLIIGGNKLSRGLTIPRLITTYYGRYTSDPKVDTLSQHARMCGYREKDLNITKVFITEDIASLFEIIADHDKTQREIIKKNGISNTLYLDYNKIDPTRPYVIPNAVGAYEAGSMYMPKLPEYRKNKGLEIITENIDNIMCLYKQRSLHTVETELIIKLINMIPIHLSGSWKSEVITQYLDWYKAKYKKSSSYLYYIPNSNISRNIHRGIPAVLSEQIYDEMKNVDKNFPLFVLYKIVGSEDRNWDGIDFWMPIIRFPQDGYNLIFNLNNVYKK